MHSARHYRNRAAQARRLAAGTLDRELTDRLTGLALEYDAIADRIEQLGGDKPPPEEN
jgi:hypothetical protein